MNQPKKPMEPQMTWRTYSGSREEIRNAIDADHLPANWGAHEVVRAYIMEITPAGETWRGTIRVTGYRTPVNDKGTGTAYVSVHWEP